MPSRIRLTLAAGVLAGFLLAPAALTAQATATVPAATGADSLAYPRQLVKWVMSAQGDSAFAHAGEKLRESMKSAQGVNDMAGRIATRFGDAQGVDAEVQFDEGDRKVYIAVQRFSQAPEPAAWVVVYSPATKVVERASFGPAARAKASYPQAKLP